MGLGSWVRVRVLESSGRNKGFSGRIIGTLHHINQSEILSIQALFIITFGPLSCGWSTECRTGQHQLFDHLISEY